MNFLSNGDIWQIVKAVVFRSTVSYLPVLIYILAVVHIFSYCREFEDYI